KAFSTTVTAILAGTFAAWFVFRTGFSANAFPVPNIATVGSAAIAGLLFLVGSNFAGKIGDAKEAQQAVSVALAESVGSVACIAMAALLTSALALSVPGTVL